MFGVRDFITIAATALLVGGLSFVVGRIVGDGEGYDRLKAEIAVNDAKIELKRKGEDAKLQSMSDYDLCRHALRAAGMPLDACEQLRGLRSE